MTVQMKVSLFLFVLLTALVIHTIVYGRPTTPDRLVQDVQTGAWSPLDSPDPGLECWVWRSGMGTAAVGGPVCREVARGQD
jgi:hypothetical protein